MKKLLQNLSLVGASLAFTLVLAEVMLHFLPVSTGVGFSVVDDHNTVMKAHPNREITYSKDWNFKLVTHKHVNNAGFLNTQDYTTNDSRPMLAVVGDSFVEGLQLNDDETYFAKLTNAQDKLRVYSFGFSGAALSQYLIWAQYAKQNYNNKYLIINVVGNDFDESLKKYKFAHGFYHYAPNADNELTLERQNLINDGRMRNLAKKSKLLGYLMRNVEITEATQKFKNRFKKTNKVNYGNVATTDTNEQYIQDSYAAIDAFFKDLPHYSGLAASNIAFVLDDRTLTYGDEDRASELADSYFYKMKAHFMQKAKELGYTAFDMGPAFGEHYKQHGKRFEFSFDYHWNALGHSVVADTIQGSNWWRDLFVFA